MDKPEKLYHGSKQLIEGPFKPILNQSSVDHIHTKPAVFATDRADVASLFMLGVSQGLIFSIGFEQDIAYMCIWGTREEFVSKDHEGYLYTFSSEKFEKVGKEYEWQSFSEVTPIEIKKFDSVVLGMMHYGAQVYFIHDDPTFDRIVADKNNRASILKNLVSENQKENKNVRLF